MTDIKQQVGQLIRDTRVKAGLTQKELGEKMGVTESMINKYENGKQNPSVETLYKMISATGATLIISAQ